MGALKTAPTRAVLYKKKDMNIKKFWLSTVTEMKQVTWPTRSRVIVFTVVVIIVSLLIGYLLGAFDALFGLGLKTLIIK